MVHNTKKVTRKKLKWRKTFAIISQVNESRRWQDNTPLSPTDRSSRQTNQQRNSRLELPLIK
jgi:hypothetical protein